MTLDEAARRQIGNVDAAGNPSNGPAGGKEPLEEELSRANAERAMLKSLVASQREELQTLRQEIDQAREGLAQYKALRERELHELNHHLAQAEAINQQRQLQVDTIYALFKSMREIAIPSVLNMIEPFVRDANLYNAIISIITSKLFDTSYYSQQHHDEEIPSGMAPIIHYLQVGDFNEINPHPLFDVRYYRNQLPSERKNNNTLLDYLKDGDDLAPHPLFMPTYYIKQLPALVTMTGVAPLVHYCVAGDTSGASPHPLFDIAYYGRQLDERGIQPPANLLAFYLGHAQAEAGISPHPLFDPAFYLSRYPHAHNTVGGPLVHYLTLGDAAGCNPHPYFHTQFYRLTNPELGPDGPPALTHFVQADPTSEERSPHPMFNPAYYRQANPEVAKTAMRGPSLIHFVMEGEAKGLSPHPLIDLAYVRQQLAARAMDDRLPFRALLDPENVQWLSPHPLFDVGYYRAASSGAATYAGGPFLFYLLTGHRLDEPVHPLFDPKFYRTEAASLGTEVGDPLVHFLSHETAGAGRRPSPHPLFDINYYLLDGPNVEGNPLLDYLEHGDKGARNPHPLFNVEYYKRGAGLADENALLHYLATAGRAGDPHPLFDSRHYSQALSQPGSHETAPLLAYLTGKDGGSTDPHPLFSQEYYWSQIPDDERGRRPALLDYVVRGEMGRSPHPLFDLEFFKAGLHQLQPPALAHYLDQFSALAQTKWELHRLNFREANGSFCSLSYLLDHPDLAPGEIPFLHFLRNGGPAARIHVDRHALSAGRKSASRIGAKWQVIDAQRLIDCAEDRTSLSATMSIEAGTAARRAQDKSYEALGERLAGVEIRSRRSGESSGFSRSSMSNRRFALYSIGRGSGGKHSHHQMLATLREAGYVTIVVADAGAEQALGKNLDIVDLWISHDRGGGDFLNWASTLAFFVQTLSRARHILLVNDRLVGPVGDLRPLLRRMERASTAICGLTAVARGSKRHLQADFLHIAGDGFASGALSRAMLSGLAATATGSAPELPIDPDLAAGGEIGVLIDEAAVAQNWSDAIPDQIAWARALPTRLGELGLTAHISRPVARRYADYLEDWLSDRADAVRRAEHFDPQHVFWDALIGAGFPFLNKELLLVNRHRVPTLIRLGEICTRDGDAPLRETLRALVPETNGFPRSYLRLSEALIDSRNAAAA